jgi:hypothetical protein
MMNKTLVRAAGEKYIPEEVMLFQSRIQMVCSKNLPEIKFSKSNRPNTILYIHGGLFV